MVSTLQTDSRVVNEAGLNPALEAINPEAQKITGTSKTISTGALNTDVLSVNAIRTLAAATTKGVHDKISYAADVLKNSLAAYSQMNSEFKNEVTPEQLAKAAKIGFKIAPTIVNAVTNPGATTLEGIIALARSGGAVEGQEGITNAGLNVTRPDGKGQSGFKR